LWRHAAGAIEAHRERWELPGDPSSGSPQAARDPAPGRQADDLLIMVACRVAARAVRAREIDRGVDVSCR
jgi:hypothetical protein